VADVSTKGAGAALVMATLRMALRTMPPGLDPKARVDLTAESMAGVLSDDGLSVTLFHGRLDLESGLLRYVSAGHDCSAVRRADGEIVRLESGAPPLGEAGPEGFEEHQVVLEPGDALLVYTDGLVETSMGTVAVQDLVGGLDEAQSAEGVVARLVGRVMGRQSDDATVVLLRRTAQPARRTRSSSEPGRAARARPT
jgi:serine phosphatase RsbU (regulator of sigma subunit)